MKCLVLSLVEIRENGRSHVRLKMRKAVLRGMTVWPGGVDVGTGIRTVMEGCEMLRSLCEPCWQFPRVT